MLISYLSLDYIILLFRYILMCIYIRFYKCKQLTNVERKKHATISHCKTHSKGNKPQFRVISTLISFSIPIPSQYSYTERTYSFPEGIFTVSISVLEKTFSASAVEIVGSIINFSPGWKKRINLFPELFH